MSVSCFVVDGVVLQGRPVREVALEVGLSSRWVYRLVERYRQGGYEALEPRSRRPKSNPNQLCPQIEDEIILLRKTLDDLGVDAGPHTILYHLEKRYRHHTSVATIWRVLKRRGFITAQPQKKPKSSWCRFQAALPNQTWQTDTTHWALADNTDIEILNFMDDHSRYILACKAYKNVSTTNVVDTFNKITSVYGLPQSMLSDNGAIYTGRFRHGKVAFENLLEQKHVAFKHGQPYHPQTQGKIERWHQTLKKYLEKQTPPQTISELQTQLDTFVDYYNQQRPHRSLDRKTPAQTYNKQIKAHPIKHQQQHTYRIRKDTIDTFGKVTLRHNSTLYHIGIGRKHANKKIKIYCHNLNIKITTTDGITIREFTLDPTRKYQPQNQNTKLKNKEKSEQ